MACSERATPSLWFEKTARDGRDMAKKSDDRLTVARNRRARYDYEIDDTFEAGIVLTGTEVKSLRGGQATIGDGYVQVKGGEAWLLGAYIPEYTHGNLNNHPPRRDRKLLLHGHEIDKIVHRLGQQGYTGVPMEIYFRRGVAKLEFGLGKGKKKFDKRQAEKQKSDRREMRNAY